MKQLFSILMAIIILVGSIGCAGIPYYFQPDIDPNVKWSTEDGSVWFINDGKTNPANIYGKSLHSAFDSSNKLDFLIFDGNKSRINISCTCDFSKKKIIATVRYDENNILGVGTVLIFYK